MRYALLIIGLLILSHCSLEEEVLDEASGEQLRNNADPLSLAAPAYAQLIKLINPNSVWGISEVSSDEMIIPTRGTDWSDNGTWRQLHLHQWDPFNAKLLDTWQSLKIGVARANTGLFELQKFDSSEEIETLKAELRFLRAYYRFWLLDLFRQIPLRSELDQDFLTPPVVIKREEATRWIINELKEIIPSLKSISEAPPYGRITSEAGKALLAKIYLNANVYSGEVKWVECLEVCNEIINSNNYSLSNDYFKIFSVDNNLNNSEAIFVIRQSGIMPAANRIFHGPSTTLHGAQNFQIGAFFFNGMCTVESFLKKWDQDGDLSNGVNTDDLRFQDDRIKNTTGTNLGFLIGPQFHPDGSPVMVGNKQLVYTIDFDLFAQTNDGVRVLKYEPDLMSNNPPLWGKNDYILFRIADIHLMKAECLFRMGNITEALNEINLLREIRNAPGLDNLTEDDILDERGFELYWEGWRRQDLVRFGKFREGWSNKGTTEKFNEVFPIPQDALDVNPNLEQNPGY